MHAAATAGDGVLGAGADACPERPLRLAGERLRAADVAALQTAGIARVRVREPRVRVVSTAGAETDAVALAISRAASAHGIVVIFVRALERALADEQTDIVITIGGTGAGRNDHSVAMLRRMGEVHIHGFGIAPGETAALGSAKGHPVLMLPARLDAALAAFLIVGDALLRRLTGALTSEPAMPVTLARKIVSTVGLAEVVPVRRVADGVEPLASGYWPVQALTRADGWVLVPPESEGFAAGTPAGDAGVPMNDASRTRPEIALLDAVRAAARQEQFLEVVSAEDAKARFEKHLDLTPLGGPRPSRSPMRSAACWRMTSRRRSTCRRSTAPMSTASRCAPPIRPAPPRQRRAASRSTPRCSPAAMRRSSPSRPAPRPRSRPAAWCRAAPTPW